MLRMMESMPMCAFLLLVLLVEAEAFSAPLFPRQSSLSIQRLGRASIHEAPLPTEILKLQSDVEKIRRLERVINNDSLVNTYASNNMDRICMYDKPTFRRLFTHETWEIHLGGNQLQRWIKCIQTVPHSVIILATWQSVLVVAGYAFCIAKFLPATFFHATLNQEIAVSFCGSAIGLLLVFRTNAAYERLNEARRLWGRASELVAQIASRVATCDSGAEDGAEEGGSLSTGCVVEMCRYLIAFCWCMRDELRDGDRREDILKLLLQSEAEERWVAASPSRPLAIHNRLRSRLHAAWRRGQVPEHVMLLVEGDLGALASTAADCHRLFTSPIPPTMSRHGLRCLLMWLLALPVALAGTSPAWTTATWTATTAFVYLGIDELGVQVEQPFVIMPLWQICQETQEAVLGAVSTPHRPVL